ncbi:hypothetical protein [Humibacter ginsengisoli]
MGECEVADFLVDAPASLGGEEFAKWGVDLVTDDFLVDDVDVLEDGLVEEPPGLVTGMAVELVGVFQEGDVGLDVRHSGCDVVLDGFELCLGLFALPGDVAEPDACS